MACRLPGAGSVAELEGLLFAGTDAVTEIPRDRWAHHFFLHPVPGTKGKTYTFAAGIVDSLWRFDPDVFGISPREAAQMDPQQRLLLHVVWEALEDAGLPPDSLAGTGTGVFVGCSAMAHASRLAHDAALSDSHLMTGNTLSLVANRVSHVLDLRGPSMTVDTACSSSIVALKLAQDALLRGEIDTAIVAGVNALLDPMHYIGFSAARMLSPTGRCRPFSSRADGYVRAEGAVALVLERRTARSLAPRRAHAVLRAVDTNTDGRTLNVAFPSVEGQAALLRRVYDRSGIDPARLAFVEAHGTGTLVGDPVEATALGQVLGQARTEALPIGSVKSNIGHLEPAAGVAGMVKAMIALKRRELPGSLHLDELNPAIPFGELNLQVVDRPLPLVRGEGPLLAGVNSFGFGGSNTHVILEEAPVAAAPVPRKAAGEAPVLLLSAAAEVSLRGAMEGWRGLVAGAGEAGGLAELAGQAAAYRALLPLRAAVICDDAAAVAGALERGAAGRDDPRLFLARSDLRDAPAAFVFSGNGSQYAGMGLRAMARDGAYARSLRRTDRAFRRIAGWSIIAAMQAPDLEQRLQDCAVAQPLLFADQMALVDALAARGLRPAAVMGHSGGEVAAACASGALTLEDALVVIHRRSLALQPMRGAGTMAAVQAAAGDVAAAIAASGIAVEIAAENSPGSVTIVGDHVAVEAFLRHARREMRWPAVRLAIDYPYHGAAVEGVRDVLLEGLARLRPQAPTVPFVSSVRAAVVEGPALDAAYWWDNVRRPVAFAPAMDVLGGMGLRAFVEIGPSPVLQGYMAACAAGGDGAAVLPGLERAAAQDAGVNPVAAVVARAVAAGLRVTGWDVLPRPQGMRDDLPSYRWTGAEIRIDQVGGVRNRLGLDAALHPYIGREEGISAGVWLTEVDPHTAGFLADHRVGGRIVMPATMIVEFALAAARETVGSDRLLLTDLDILAPTALSRQTTLQVQTRVAPQGRVTMATRNRGSEAPFRISAQARMHPLEAAGWPEAAPEPDVREGDRKGDLGYVVSSRNGLEYGPAFAIIDRARTVTTSEVEVFIRDDGRVLPANTLLDVTGADAALQGLLVTLEYTPAIRKGLAFVPIRIGRLSLFRAGAKVASARVRNLRQGERSMLAQIALYDAAGACIAVLEEVRLQVMRMVRDVRFAQHAFRQIALPLAGESAPPVPEAGAVLAGLASAAPFAGDDAYFVAEALAQRLVAVALRDVAGGSGLVPAGAVSDWFAGVLGIGLRAGLVIEGPEGWRLTEESQGVDPAPLFELVRMAMPELAPEAVVLSHLAMTMARLARLEPEELPSAEAHFGRAALETLAEGSVFATRRRGAVVRMVRDLVAALPEGRALRIAEVTEGTARLLPLLLPGLPEARAVLTELVLPAQEAEGASVLPPDRVTRLAAADVGAQRFDLILSDGVLGAVGDAEAALEQVRAALAAGGQFVAVEPGPSDLADLVRGLDAGWFVAAGTDGTASRLRSGGEWAAAFRRAGFDGVAEAALPDGFGAASVVTAKGAVAEAVPAVAEDGGFRAVLAQAVAARADAVLEVAGDPLRIVAAFPRQEGADPVALMTARILALRDLMARAAQEEARLVLIVPGGSGRGAGAADPSQTGFWALVRSAVNETPSVPVARYDIAPDLPAERAVADIARLEQAGSAETEVVLGRAGVSVLRAVLGAAGADATEAAGDMRSVLRAVSGGTLDDLAWVPEPRVAPVGDEVEIAVEATGLNYRDVMWTMGLLPEEALENGFAGPTIGIECAGRVTRCGPAVTGLKPGDVVLANGPSCFASHVVVREGQARPLPEGITPEAAATVPVAFFTAWYALVTLGRLAAGETVLVHGGAGGVGLAAVQIARHLGARVIATAGSGAKRSYLRGLGVDDVLDSRSLRFVDEVRALTGGRGVDVVLNSLAGEAMERSIGCLAPFGRFLELGKQDFYANTAVGLRVLKDNVTYHGIDVDSVMAARPALAAGVLTEVLGAFAEGGLVPLPYRAFGPDEAVSAFRLMQASGHVGKVVLRPKDPAEVRLLDPALGLFAACPERAHLVIGGLGGLGREVAQWLVEAGARKIVLMGRRSEPDAAAAVDIDRWRRRGAEVRLVACDVSDGDALAAALDGIGPLAGVIHSAMVLEDMPLSALTPEVLARVLPAKVAGATHLDRLTRGMALDYFVLFTSMATLIGNHGQSAYVAANGYLEGIALAWRQAGLPALAVGWGGISDAGYLARDTDKAALVRRMSGNVEFTGVQAVRALDRLLAPGMMADPVVHVSPMGWNAVAGTLKTLSEPSFALFRALGRKGEAETGGDDLRGLLVGLTRERAEAHLVAWLAGRVAHILRVPEKSVATTRPITELGIDSLMGVELGLTLQEALGDDVAVAGMSEKSSIQDIAARIVRHLHAPQGGGRGVAADDAEAAAVRLAEQHLTISREAAE